MSYIVEALDPEGRPVTFSAANPQQARKKAMMLRVAGFLAVRMKRQTPKSGGLAARNRRIRLQTVSQR